MPAASAKGSLPSPVDWETRERARELYCGGMKASDVAAELGLKAVTVRAWAARNKDTWKRTADEGAIVPEESEDDIPETLGDCQEEYEQNLRKAAIKFSRRVAHMDGDTIVQKSQHIKAVDQTARKALRIETEKPMPVINLAVLCQSPAKLARRPREETLTLE
jgi:Putative ATPase subunit of terminase (gpP-like)